MYFLTVLLVAGTQIHYLLSARSVLIQGELFPGKKKRRKTPIVLKDFILIVIRTITWFIVKNHLKQNT